MDELDVKREGDKAARQMITSLHNSHGVRNMLKKNVLDMYRNAVQYQGLPEGMEKAWLLGWRKGYGL